MNQFQGTSSFTSRQSQVQARAERNGKRFPRLLLLDLKITVLFWPLKENKNTPEYLILCNLDSHISQRSNWSFLPARNIFTSRWITTETKIIENWCWKCKECENGQTFFYPPPVHWTLIKSLSIYISIINNGQT